MTVVSSPARPGPAALRARLEAAGVRTWFDLGLHLDGLRDRRGWPVAGTGDADALRARAVAHCGRIGAPGLAPANAVALDDALSDWPDAAQLFETRLERGGAAYNRLIGSLWAHATEIAVGLAERIERHDLHCLLIGDLWSRPDRVSAALALILVCEHLRLPVVAEHRNGIWHEPGAFRANAHLGEIYTIVEVCFPWDSPWVAHRVADDADRAHLVRDHGINPAWVSVGGDLDSALAAPLAYAAGIPAQTAAERALQAHRQVTREDDAFRAIVRVTHRRYLSGLTPLEYMIRLASLIDPNAFRVEEQQRRGRVFAFALARVAQSAAASESQAQAFLRDCEFLFEWHTGEDTLVVDHSLSYRHRHLRHYPYRKLTEPELCGLVGQLAEQHLPAPVGGPPGECESLLRQSMPHIDFRHRLAQALASGRSLCVLPDAGESVADDLAWLAEHLAEATEVTVIARRSWGGGSVTAAGVREALQAQAPWRARLDDGRCRVLAAPMVSAATHLAQLGEAAAALAAIRAAGGLVVSFGHGNTLSLDCLALDSFRIGRCEDALQAGYMDLAEGEAYCLWVPPALRPSLAFPTPIQTPRQFAQALSSADFERACARLGEARVLAALADDADRYGTPIAEVLESLLAGDEASGDAALSSHRFTGLHANGEPWSGACARLRLDAGWRFDTVVAQSRSDTVLDLMRQYQARHGVRPPLAWNGGYILNAELVGKLALPEDYIGTPLGLLIDRGRVRSLPLLNKPAMGFGADGEVVIREANLRQGLTISVPGGGELSLTPGMRNRPSTDQPAYFDLFHEHESLAVGGRVAYRFAGGRIISVHRDIEQLPLLPVGLTVTVPASQAPAGWEAGVEVEYALPGWDGIAGAIEAGPMIVRDGVESIEMGAGGWTTEASIRTQAARLDYTHMRGPKIAVGLTRSQELLVLAVNGRIRESVGATHGEMARILIDMGAVTAMGFDPGGSVTLVVHDRQLNISPYNRGYMENPITLPPEPRFVGNAVLAMPGD